MPDLIDPWAVLKAVKQAKQESDSPDGFSRPDQVDGALANSSQRLSRTFDGENVAKSIGYDAFSQFSHFSRGEHELSPTSRLAPKERKRRRYIYISIGYGLEDGLGSGDDLVVPFSQDGTSAKVANRLEFDLTHSQSKEIYNPGLAKVFEPQSTVPGPIDYARAPLSWRTGFERLERRREPCRGFRSWEWAQAYKIALLFMEQCAAQAALLGWTALDLFAVHPVAGAARIDFCGALMVPVSSAATAVAAEAITFGAVVYRKMVLPEGAVLVWDAGPRCGHNAPARDSQG